MPPGSDNFSSQGAAPRWYAKLHHLQKGPVAPKDRKFVFFSPPGLKIPQRAGRAFLLQYCSGMHFLFLLTIGGIPGD